MNANRSLMRKHNLSTVGLLLVVLGTGALWLGGLNVHNWIPAVNAGSIHLDGHMDRRISIPTVSGVFTLLAGIGIITIRWRRA